MKTNLTHRHLLMGYSSRRPHSSSEQDTEATIFTVHQMRPAKIGNVSSGLMSPFLLPHSDGGIRIWWERHESIDPSWLLSTIQAGVGLIVTLHEYFCWSSVYEHGIYWWLLPAGKQSMSQRSNLKMVSWTRLWVHWTQMISTYL